MDIAQLLRMLQQTQGAAGATPSGAAGSGAMLDQLVASVAGQKGVAPDALSGLLGTLTRQMQNGVTDNAALVQAGAQQSGFDMQTVLQLLQGLMAQGAARGAIPAGQGADWMGMATQMLDRNRDGSIVDDLMGMAGGLMGRK